MRANAGDHSTLGLYTCLGRFGSRGQLTAKVWEKAVQELGKAARIFESYFTR